jgi:uncharacterized damage-inducible protein DinB
VGEIIKTNIMQMPSSVSTRLQYQHKSLMDVVDGLSDEQVRRPVIAGKWTIFEHIVHLQVYQHIFIDRIKQILGNTNPSFPAYSAEADPLFLDNCHKSTWEVMQDLITTRKEIAASMNSFAAAELAKIGTHSAFGQMTVIQWLNFFLLHEAHHFFTIFKMTAALKKL